MGLGKGLGKREDDAVTSSNCHRIGPGHHPNYPTLRCLFSS